MKANVGTTDKIIRVTLAALFAVLFLAKVVTGTLGIVLLVLAGTLILTSFISWCPVYLPFGLSTRKKEKSVV
jgi:hypothetical protein